jgi:nucleoside-diphosphate-sugar epimerase
MRVAVIGASGFVGVAVVEDLRRRGVDTVPVIHSPGNAWRLIRLGIPLRQADLLIPGQAQAAIAECTHVINCLRGSDQIMIEGMENLLRACGEQRIEKLVHLSSVAVYGDPPPPEAVSESAPTLPAQGSYGSIKLAQDLMVAKAAAKGLPAVVLCPPNIIGPYSDYLLQLLQTLNRRQFALLDDGHAVCNTVDVANLAHAAVTALDSKVTDGSRYFVTDDEDVTWGAVVSRLQGIGGISPDLPHITAAELRRRRDAQADKRPLSLWRAVKHTFSSGVREALRRDPLWEKVDGTVRKMVNRMGTHLEDSLRESIEGHATVPVVDASPQLNVQLSAQQLRGVRHSCSLAKTTLGYRPCYSFSQSMDAFSRWLVATRGMNDADWNLTRHLYA